MPSTKKKEEKAPRKPTIHSVREKKQNRIIVIGFIITAVLIVGMVAYALLYDSVLKNHIAVAKVDNSKIDNQYFEERVRLERNAYIQQYSLLYSQYQMFASVEEYADYADYYVSQLQQVQSILDDYEGFGELVLDEIIDDQVLALEAKEMGIEVSDEEIDKLMMELFSYYPDGTPTPEPTSTPYMAPAVSEAQEALLGYTPTPEIEETEEVIVEEVGDETEEVAEETTELESEKVESTEVTESEEAEVAEETIVSGTATPEPTATVYTEELYQEQITAYLTDLESVGVSEEYLRKYIYHYLLDQKVQEQIYAEVQVEQEQVWARHILVETEEEAQDVLDRLNAGEDWNVVAAEVSLDTSNSANGGDLGWFIKGYMVEPFEEAAFALQEGEISEPVETDFGWHIIQVIGHEVRPLSAEDYEYAQQIYYEDWVTAAKEEKTIKINDVWKELVPEEPSLSTEYAVE